MSPFARPLPALSCLPLMALTMLLNPAVAHAESMVVHLVTTGNIPPASAVTRSAAHWPTAVGLNENGDLIVRHHDVSLVVAYNGPVDVLNSREASRNNLRLDCPSINGISLSIHVAF